MKKKKRQHSRTLYKRVYRDGSGLSVRVISRKSSGRPFDVIELCMGDGTKENMIHAYMSPDEAIELCRALSVAVDFWICRWGPYKRWRRKGSSLSNWGDGPVEVE